jgi:hypothetical protein
LSTTLATHYRPSLAFLLQRRPDARVAFCEKGEVVRGY